MSTYSFDRAPDEFSADAWRALDRALAHWVRAHGGCAQLAAIAAWASLADGMGDTALVLGGIEPGRHGMPPVTTQSLAAVRADALVGDGESAKPTPFVLDQDNRFALWRNHAHEVAVAGRIAQRRNVVPAPGGARQDGLDALFHNDRSDAVKRQRAAVGTIVGRRLFVLTGGPGTGKTTTVLRMLLMLQRQSPVPLTIQVAAPTGKAAQRLLQALRQGKKNLTEHPRAALPADWQPLLARIPDDEAQTVHRLLGFDPRRNVFVRSESRPLAADVVVVDEASMLDLGMLRALLDAVRPDALLVLVGDADQLTSVAAGSVLMDLVGALERVQAPELVRLEHSFRAERALLSINQAVLSGQPDALAEAFLAAGKQAQRVQVDTSARLRGQLERWAQELAKLPIRPLLDAAASTAHPSARMSAAHTALRALAQRQLLCALREDQFGALAANQVIEHCLRKAWDVHEDALWYPGRAILVTHNDYSTRLFNGDVGVALADASGNLRVWFETVLPDGHVAARAFAPGMLPPHEGAFAITIHKSQGSEYSHAAVLLPPDPEHRILSRQLLYTGLSRARREVELWASDGAVAAALAQPVSRAGGLAARLERAGLAI